MAEIQVTDEQGNTHIFPDGSTPEMMAKALNVKVGAPGAPPPPSSGGGNVVQRFLDASVTPPAGTKMDNSAEGIANQAYYGVPQGIEHVIAHPLDTLSGIGQLMIHPRSTSAQNAQQIVNQPVLALGQGLGAAAAMAPVGEVAGMAARSVGDTASAIANKAYPTSQSIVPKVSVARNLAKALVVDPQAAPNFIKAATDETGTVVGYAKENNLPINGKVDFVNAAKSAADAVQSHFDAILKPSADKVSAVPASYQGVRVGEGPNATLGAINDRINAINQELKPNFRKATAAQTSTANVSDADLIAEKQALTNLLHNKLAADSGLQASDIANIRQQAGKLRTIADEANLSANRDLAAAGKQAMGATTSAVGTKVGMIDRVLQAAQGGPEIIGNRQVLSALKNVEPQPLNLPQPTAANAPVMSRMEQLLAESKQRFAQQRAKQLINSALKMYPEQQ